VRSTWTDALLDDFKNQVSVRFDELGGRIDHQSNRIDALQHTILVVGGGLFAAFVALLAGDHRFDRDPALIAGARG
jgi:hypothetical protein